MNFKPIVEAIFSAVSNSAFEYVDCEVQGFP